MLQPSSLRGNSATTPIILLFKLPVDPQREVSGHGDLFSYPEGIVREYRENTKGILLTRREDEEERLKKDSRRLTGKKNAEDEREREREMRELSSSQYKR